MSAPPPPPVGVDPFDGRFDPTAETLAVVPLSPTLPAAGSGPDMFSVRVDEEVPPARAEPIVPIEHASFASTLPVEPTAPALPTPDPFVGRIDDAASTLPVEPTAPARPPSEPFPAPQQAPRPPRPADPFSRFIDADDETGESFPLPGLEEATQQPAADPFSTRVVPDRPVGRRPSGADTQPETELFKDPLSARIDPTSRGEVPTAPPDEPASAPPRFSRHVSTVAIPIRAGRSTDFASVSARVRQARRERDSRDPDYVLSDLVRRAPRRRKMARVLDRTPHRNLLRDLLTR